jgi:RNA polymerase sigma-70 factor (ECF subfamily)
MVSILTRIFGIHNLELAEDVVQEAFTKATQQWSFNGVPENPSGWLLQVAKNKAIDVIRREKYSREFANDLTYISKSEWTINTIGNFFLETEIEDSQLRMIFTCCHSALQAESQIALTLKTLSGFSIAEIAKALLTNESTINKRLYRAKQLIREENIQFEIPSRKELHERLENVYTVLYLLFNEGYNSSAADTLIRKDLCLEAIRLCKLLSEHTVGDNPETFALLALMCYHAARFDSRIDSEGSIILLKYQDRKNWNSELIERGNYYLDKASTGTSYTAYHIEAAIASIHCATESFEKTNWKLILKLYDSLLEKKDTPVIRLNRAIVISKVYSADKAIEEINKIEDIGSLTNSFYLFSATLGDLYLQKKEFVTAKKYLDKSLKLTTSNAEKELIKKKILLCE